VSTDAGTDYDRIFGILSAHRRRLTLQVLDEADGPLSFDELTERVAAREHDTTADQLSEAHRERVATGLYQVHLPKLADADVITYDDRGDNVCLHERADEYLAYLPRDN
jgi:hypothetical protein